MKITDDTTVYKAIETSHIVKNSKGKISQTKVRNLFSAYCLIREKGLVDIKANYSKSSFYQIIQDLIACGFSKAYLQNLHDEKSKNIIPFIKFVEVNFNEQLPDWFQPPVSQFNYKVA